ncbi:MAG: hypothetical protein FWD91_06680, partial [Treponema sp.]|nr:hypothetical protein [Treponema sp.]
MKKIIFILSIAVSLLVVFGCPAVLTNPNKSAFVEPLSGEVGLNGTPAFRSTLTANISGLSGNAFSYQWMRVDPEGKASVPIAGADGSSYTIRSADIRNRVSVVVTQPATGASIEGGPSPLVYDPEKPALSGSVTISGGSSPMPGSVLTADVSNLTGDGATFYTWSREGITVGIDVSYTVKDSDMGKKLTLVVVKANNSSSATDSTGMVGGPLPMPNPILPIEPGGGGINPSNTDTSPSRAAQRFTTLVSGQNKYEEFFPNKDDFYAYSELIKAIRQMAYIQLRISTIYDSNIMFSSWLLYVERNDKSEGNDYQLIYDNSNGQLSNMDSSWSSGNGTNTTIDFGNFLYDPV